MSPTHFIEQVAFENGDIKSTIVMPIKYIEYALQSSIKFRMQTIAIFKIYPHPKPVMVNYDYDLKTMVTE